MPARASPRACGLKLPATAALAVAAVRFRAKLAAQPDPAGAATARVLGGYRRTDAVIAGLLFMGELRRSEVSALEWRDVADASDSDGVLITVRSIRHVSIAKSEYLR